MTDRLSIDTLKELGDKRPAPENAVALYRRAFEEFGAQALWNRQPNANPTIAQLIVVAEVLRNEGNLKSRALAEDIERICRAAV